MSTRWVELKEYPGYAISDSGDVLNTTRDLVKHPSSNQQGIAMINFSLDGRQHVRSISLLVADTFLDRDGVPEHFDTPIHLDGNKMNCSVDNLAWRPRWFAVRYHQQFSDWQRANRYGFRQPVELIDTGEIFPTSWEAATKYGLLDHEIYVATVNRTYVFPHNYRFCEID